MTISKDRCQVLHLGQTNPAAAGTAWGTALQTRTSQSLAKLKPEHSPAAWRAEGWNHRSTGSWPRGAISQPPATTGRGQHPERDLPVQDRLRKLQWGHWKATKMVTGWNTCPVRTEDAEFLQPTEETALGRELKWQLVATYRDITKKTDTSYLMRCKVRERKN